MKKVGHTGTLDPDATGVLPICVGKATRAAELLTSADKGYRATFLLGITTDTLDMSGEIVSQTTDFVVTEEAVRAVIAGFVGEQTQIPPMYSAIKVGGKKLYELAREGIEIERKERQIIIESIEILEIDLHNKITVNLSSVNRENDLHNNVIVNSLDENLDKGLHNEIMVNQTEILAPKIVIDVKCSKGTYIRTLCADIGEKLGVGATMSELVRTQSGRFCIEDSYTLEALEQAKADGSLHNCLTPLADLFEEYSDIVIPEKYEALVKNGGAPNIKGLSVANERNLSPKDGETYRVFSENGEFLSLSIVRDERLWLLKNFV